jgi:hypothetical protein
MYVKIVLLEQHPIRCAPKGITKKIVVNV